MQKEKINILSNKAITLIALIITIIVMIILTGVTIGIAINGGIFSSATKAAFYQEMSAIEENKQISKISSFLENGTEQGEMTYFLDKQVTVEELRNFDKTLKAEIIYARNGFGKGLVFKTEKIWKDNLYQCQTAYDDDTYAQGLANDIFYISEENSGKKETYIYDRVSDTCFKIPNTKIERCIVHSLPYAKMILDGIIPEGVGVIGIESGIATASDGTLFYEPNLYNFSLKTEIIYYSPNFSQEYYMPVKEYLENDRPLTTIVNGETYTFADYKATGSEKNTVWANVKCTANGIESYWVWIPRFAYKLGEQTADIIFVDINNKQMNGEDLPEGYVVHEAFSQEDELKGIWFAKYNPTAVETSVIAKTEPDKPDLSNFNESSTKLIYYTANGNNYIEKEFTKNPEMKINEDGTDYYFYNYENKIWANVKTTANGLDAWWVWIPRFAYKLESGTSSVIFVDENNMPIDKETYGNTLPNGYKLHEAFAQEGELKGIWFAKYNPTPAEQVLDKTEPDKPDLSNFNESSTKLIYYTANGNNYIEKEFTKNPEMKISENGTDYYFYNYENKIWANVKTTANGLDAWWVWIPRFAYKLESGTSSVIFVDENNIPIDKGKYGNSLPNGYKLHDAFAQESGLKGIWFAKYNPTKVEN